MPKLQGMSCGSLRSSGLRFEGLPASQLVSQTILGLEGMGLQDSFEGSVLQVSATAQAICMSERRDTAVLPCRSGSQTQSLLELGRLY